MMQRWLTIPAILMAAPLVAQQTDPILLWGAFTTATPKAEIKAFKAKWPNKPPEVIPGCLSEMGFRHAGGRIVSITFIGQDRGANCFNRTYGHYVERFGTPATEGTTFGSVIGYGGGASIDTTSEGVIDIWREGEKKIKLVRSPGGGYNLFFTVREDKYLY